MQIDYFRHKTLSENLDRSQQQIATKKTEIENIQAELDHTSPASPASMYVFLVDCSV
jgi:uncharacterized protein YlxW (UPF0749 family)